jgi:hypothetical protein
MTWPPFTAITFLTLFASERPAEFRHDPERIAVVAIAAERAQSDLMAQWHRHPRMLGATLATVVLFESGLRENVHSGATRSSTDDVCLVQINHTNQLWRGRVETREDLAGVDLLPTSWCLATGIETLIAWDQYCSKRHPKRNWLEAMLSGYAGDRCHVSKDSTMRAREANRLAWTNWQPIESHMRAIAWALNSESTSRAAEARRLVGKL